MAVVCGECGAALSGSGAACPRCATAHVPTGPLDGPVPLGREGVGFVALGTLGYGIAVVVAVWLYLTDQITWNAARRIVGGVFVILGTGIVLVVVRSWLRRRGRAR